MRNPICADCTEELGEPVEYTCAICDARLCSEHKVFAQFGDAICEDSAKCAARAPIVVTRKPHK